MNSKFIIKKVIVPCFLLLNLNNLVYSQDSDIENAISNYFSLERESLFLHLNKSTFIVGEEIWFKGYLFNRQLSIPAVASSNVYVGLYDKEGNQLLKNLYRSKDGYSKGSIAIDSTFKSGEYYIKGSTNWMRNFFEDDSFVQKIQILNKKVVLQKNEEVQYDFQILPEGGHIINEIENNIGFKVIDQQGRGILIKEGLLIDQNNNVIQNFKSNAFGMGSFSFSPEKNTTYKVRAVLENGRQVETPMPAIKEKGISITINNSSRSSAIISLKTNKNTLKDISKKNYQLLIHQEGKSKIIPLIFNEAEVLISLKREDLFKGVNTVTLFDANKTPLLERLFFNNYQTEFPKVYASYQNSTKDSIEITLKVLSELQTPKNLSISVLPENTKSYTHRNNIFSTFLLKSYLKGFIENPGYYFINVDRKKEYDLDLLLLTQGWSRYNWDVVFNNPPVKRFEFENGITLKGRFSDPKLHKYLGFYISKSRNHPSGLFNLEGATFEVPNFFIEKDEEIQIALEKKNNEFIPSKVATQLIWNKSKDQIIPFIFTSNTYNLTQDISSYTDDNTIFLNEVEVQENQKSLRNSSFNSRNDIVVTQETVTKFPQVLDIIRSKGFIVDDHTDLGKVAILSRNIQSISQTNSLSISSEEDVINAIGNNSSQAPTLFYNGTILRDFDFLYKLNTQEIERIVINKTGYGEGSRGAGGVIKIWGRTTPLNASAKKKALSLIDASEGFTPSKKFYNPQYINYTNPVFKFYGTIHWIPEIITNNDGTVVFKVANTALKNISFYVEGMGKDGSLVAAIKSIHIK